DPPASAAPWHTERRRPLATGTKPSQSKGVRVAGARRFPPHYRRLRGVASPFPDTFRPHSPRGNRQRQAESPPPLDVAAPCLLIAPPDAPNHSESPRYHWQDRTRGDHGISRLSSLR